MQCVRSSYQNEGDVANQCSQPATVTVLCSSCSLKVIDQCLIYVQVPSQTCRCNDNSSRNRGVDVQIAVCYQLSDKVHHSFTIASNTLSKLVQNHLDI